MNQQTSASTFSSQPETSSWLTALHKDRWIEITVRYDDYFRFTDEFVLPASQQLLASNHIKSFYHCLASDYDDVLHLNLKTSQYNFQQFAPVLLKRLNNYFDPAFLSQFNVDKIDDTTLSAKAGFTTYHWPSFQIIGIEEFSFDRFPFTKGMHGKSELADFFSIISESSLHQLREHKHLDYTKRIQYHYDYCMTVLRTFTEEHRQCLDWLLLSTRKQIASPIEPKHFTPFKDSINLQHHLSTALQTLRNDLEVLDQQGLLHIWEYQQDPSEAEILRDLHEKEARQWRVISHLIHTGLGQYGIRLNERYHILQALRSGT
jgi:hypothetical protein